MFDKERFKKSLHPGTKSWVLAAIHYIIQAKEHVKTHKYTYCLLILALLVFMYRRNPEMFKRAIKYISMLI